MDILALTLTAFGGLGVGLTLGAVCFSPRVGPWTSGCDRPPAVEVPQPPTVVQVVIRQPDPFASLDPLDCRVVLQGGQPQQLIQPATVPREAQP